MGKSWAWWLRVLTLPAGSQGYRARQRRRSRMWKGKKEGEKERKRKESGKE